MSNEISSNVLDWFESIIDRKIRNESSRTTSSRHRSTVLSKEPEGTIWVSIPGVADRLPVETSLVEVNQDDVVYVTIENGTAIIDGNETAPSVSSTTVNSIVGSSVGAAFSALSDKDGVFDDLFAKNARLINAEIDNLYAEKADIDFANINVARINQAIIDQLVARSASIENLYAHYASIDYLSANYASLSYLQASYITATAIDAGYLRTNMMNADVAWIENGTIKNAAIRDEMVQSVSANKLTAGTIDASKINVANLNAKNLIVERLNGQPILGGYSCVQKTITG